MFERILLAANGSPSSRKAVEVAADIGQKYGAEVVVLHVLEQRIERARRGTHRDGLARFVRMGGAVPRKRLASRVAPCAVPGLRRAIRVTLPLEPFSDGR